MLRSPFGGNFKICSVSNQDSLQFPNKQFQNIAHREFILTCFLFDGCFPSFTCELQKDKCFPSGQEEKSWGINIIQTKNTKTILGEKIFIIHVFEKKKTLLSLGNHSWLLMI